jgi:hypothetical protein
VKTQGGFLLVRFLWAAKENEPVVRGRNPVQNDRCRQAIPLRGAFYRATLLSAISFANRICRRRAAVSGIRDGIRNSR